MKRWKRIYDKKCRFWVDSEVMVEKGGRGRGRGRKGGGEYHT